MKTVIGFDSWTGGAHHFARLIPAFKARGLNLQLVHLGSWGSDPGRPQQEVIGGLPARDISSFWGLSFLKIIDLIKPEAVVFLSVDTFSHRAFNSYCKYRGIPTLHLYHGLVRVQEVDNGKPYAANFFSQLLFVSARLKKAITKVWPSYIKAMIITGAPLSAWWRFVTDIYNLTCGNYLPLSALDARTDRGAVYVQADIEHAIKKYGFGKNNVAAVGNPDLITFGLSSEYIGCGISEKRNYQNDVIYIDTGLIYAGAIFNSASDFLEHLLSTKKLLESQGKALVVKLHPQHYKTLFPATLSENGIELVNNTDFVQRLKNCAAAIVEPSTAAMIPALMGKPVFLARYGKLAPQAYGEVLTSYPRAIELMDVSKVNDYLSEEIKQCDGTAVLQWIAVNAGPLPPEKMPERVAAIVEEMIAGSKLQDLI